MKDPRFMTRPTLARNVTLAMRWEFLWIDIWSKYRSPIVVLELDLISLVNSAR